MSRYSAVKSIHSFDAKSVRISFLMKQTITSTRAGTNRKFPEEKKALISNRGWLGDEPARHTIHSMGCYSAVNSAHKFDAKSVFTSLIIKHAGKNEIKKYFIYYILSF